MPITLADLITPLSESEARAIILGLLKAGGFPTVSWDTHSVPKRLVDVTAKLFSDVTGIVADIAHGSFLDYIPKTPTGYKWLDLVARDFYQIVPKAPVFTRGGSGGRIVLTAGPSAGPYVIHARSIKIGTPGGTRIYTNVDSGTLPLGGTLGTLTWEAENPGAAWNVPINSIVEMKTPLPGVTVNNPGVAGEWITQYGADQESHESVVLRCKARWPERGVGANLDVWTAWALAASPETVRARVFEDEPQDGAIRIVIAGATGGVSGGAVTATQTDLGTRRPLGAKPVVQAATPVDVAVVATLLVDSNYTSTAPGQVTDEITKLQATLGIGAPVVHYQLADALMNVQGAKDIVWTSPLGNVTVGPTDVVRLVPSVAVEAWANVLHSILAPAGRRVVATRIRRRVVGGVGHPGRRVGGPRPRGGEGQIRLARDGGARRLERHGRRPIAAPLARGKQRVVRRSPRPGHGKHGSERPPRGPDGRAGGARVGQRHAERGPRFRPRQPPVGALLDLH